MRSKSLWPEILIVLGLSLGQSALYAIVSLIDKLSRGPLGSQTTTLNNSLSNRQYFDLTYQLMDIMFALVPVALVFYLFYLAGRNGFRALGFDLRRPGKDSWQGVGLFVLIGGGTLGLYAVGR
ncbi:MAG: CPBP family intramembrane metalloprotease domain-containing protein, partial [Micrococcaceae bacterium]|nr:CPBP family intramembrane metalloprotease domain-containing protein [Micrococcaceae bacterium]